MSHESDKKDLAQARPFIQTAVALAVCLRYAEPGDRTEQQLIESAYVTADRFLAQLEKDLKS